MRYGDFTLHDGGAILVDVKGTNIRSSAADPTGSATHAVKFSWGGGGGWDVHLVITRPGAGPAGAYSGYSVSGTNGVTAA